METISGITPGQVGLVVQDFVNDGATNINVQQDEDGTYTVTRE
ncbi:MAG TPA: hypothetical protein VF883_10115 [Thermoanaerobaculia bacterium]|jgi:hypothetical protein